MAVPSIKVGDDDAFEKGVCGGSGYSLSPLKKGERGGLGVCAGENPPLAPLCERGVYGGFLKVRCRFRLFASPFGKGGMRGIQY